MLEGIATPTTRLRNDDGGDNRRTKNNHESGNNVVNDGSKICDENSHMKTHSTSYHFFLEPVKLNIAKARTFVWRRQPTDTGLTACQFVRVNLFYCTRSVH